MKKLTTLLFISILSITMYAKNTTKIQNSETERVIDKYGSKIVDSFNAFADKTLPIAEEGFKMVVKLQIAKGIGYFIPLILLIIFGRIAMKEYQRLCKLLNSEKVPKRMCSSYGPFSEENVTVLLIISTIFSVILLLTMPFTTYQGILYLIAPEWYAIKEIIKLF